MAEQRQALDISEALPLLAGDGWRGALRSWLDGLLGLPSIRESFRRAADRGGNFFEQACHEFRVVIEATDMDFPSRGPLMVVANHPFGGADALVLGALCRRARPDTLMLANEMVAELPGMEGISLPLSILGASGAGRRNAASLRRALAHLKSGGSLAAFPSGEVACWRGAGVEEGPWSPHVAALAQRSRATVVPVRFHGQCPPWFHLLGALHPLMRTAMLPRVLLAGRGRGVECRAGAWISASDHAELDPGEFAAWLRRETLAIRQA